MGLDGRESMARGQSGPAFKQTFWRITDGKRNVYFSIYDRFKGKSQFQGVEL